MPNPAAILVKAMLVLAVAVVLFQLAQSVQTVQVTVFADGTMTSSTVGADDPTYRDELDSARKKAMWLYLFSGLLALMGVVTTLRSVRVYLRRRAARNDAVRCGW